MTRSRLALVLLAAALVLPAAAAAKGPGEASITGPGLGKALRIAGNGESVGTPLGQITQLTGFFPAAFGQSPDPMLKQAPTGDLGPRYTIHYVVPGGDGRTFRVVQDVYPYAHGGALTYTKPGQPIFDSTTRGGWFPGGLPLKLALVHEGLPAKAASSGTNVALVAGIAVPGAFALAAAAMLAAGYRRRQKQA
jgi:hypothetical protein